MAEDPKATIKIRFTKDSEEVFALENGRRRTVKIPRGTIKMVRPASARYWIRSMGAAEQVRDASTPASIPSIGLKFEPEETDTPSLMNDLLMIRDGLAKQDIEPVYETFKRISAEELTGIDGLTGDSAMVLQAAHEEVTKTGAIDTIAIGDLNDAVNDAITALGKAPAGSGVPALPGMPTVGGARRGPGRPKASK